MWKAPSRPKNEITQSFNSGVVRIFSVKDCSDPGTKPHPVPDEMKAEVRYDERSLGIRRYFTALENQVQVDRVIRIPKAADISSQDIAITQDGKRYRIDLVQQTSGVYPPCLDLTLTRIEQNYEVHHEMV